MAEEDVIENDGEEGNDDTGDRDYEADAREMGWKPQDEWSGPEDGWRDAKSFVQRGEEILPIVKQQSKKFREQNAKLQDEVSDLKKTVESFKDWRSKTEKNAYERAMKTILSQQEKAVEDGDTEQFRKLEAEKADLNKETKAEETPTDPKGLPASEQRVVEDWVSDNKWFNKDIELNGYAQAVHMNLRKQHPEWDLEDNLEEVTKRVKEKFPEKFENSRASRPSKVNGGGIPKAQGQGNSYSDLPADAKQACDDFVKQGLMTKQEYIKEYFAHG